jgi:hypothetical protein
MKRLLILTALISPFIVNAHPGHSHVDSNSIMHYLGTMDHAFPIAGMVSLFVLFLFRWYKRSTAKDF